MNRPALETLGIRSAPPLHRTLPTWAREPKEGGVLQWRLYRRHRGAALYAIVDIQAATSRSDAAAELRRIRKTLFGRDKVSVVAIDSALPPPALIQEKPTNTETGIEPLAQTAPAITAQSPEPITKASQGSLF